MTNDFEKRVIGTFDVIAGELVHMRTRFDALETKVDAIHTTVERMDRRLLRHEERIERLDRTSSS